MDKNTDILNNRLSFEEFASLAINIPRRDYATVFVLVRLEVLENPEQRECMYPEFGIRRVITGVFTDKGEAEAGIRTSVESAREDGIVIYCFKLYEVPLNYVCMIGVLQSLRSVREYLYDGSGKELDYTTTSSFEEDVATPYGLFLGKPKDQIRFKKGDLVEVIEHNKVRLAVVSHNPIDTKWCYRLYRRLVENDRLPYILDYSDYQVAVIDGPSYVTHRHVLLCNLKSPTFPIPDDIRQRYVDYFLECEREATQTTVKDSELES